MIKKSSKHCALIIAIFTVLVVSCTPLKSGDSPHADGEIPDMVLLESRYVFGRKSDNPIVFNAEKITIYSDINPRTELENVSFSKNDSDGVEELYGKCKRAVITENNTFAILSGGVHLENKTDGTIIDCDNLQYNDNDNSIFTDSVIEVSYSGDTNIKAKGFSAKLSDNKYEFVQIIEGVINIKD